MRLRALVARFGLSKLRKPFCDVYGWVRTLQEDSKLYRAWLKARSAETSAGFGMFA
jgi:hypothetical protein